jgi:hypothetical protein
VAGLLVPPGARSGEAVIAQDTYVSAKFPRKSFGASPALKVGPQELAYLRFDLADAAAGHVARAGSACDLVLWPSRVAAPGTLDVRVVEEAWHEQTAASPALGEAAVASGMVSGAKQYVLLDVTDLVRRWLEDPAANHGVALRSHDGLLSASFASKENRPPRARAVDRAGEQRAEGPEGPPAQRARLALPDPRVPPDLRASPVRLGSQDQPDLPGRKAQSALPAVPVPRERRASRDRAAASPRAVGLPMPHAQAKLNTPGAIPT